MNHNLNNVDKVRLAIYLLENKNFYINFNIKDIIILLKKVLNKLDSSNSKNIGFNKINSNLILAENYLKMTLSNGDVALQATEDGLLIGGNSTKIANSVDILNEGIDVPDINILVFLRATHSRRIFVQQLGRGLRLSKGKEKVIVLDFVSDVRRMADVMEMNNEGIRKGTEKEVYYLQEGFVSFSDARVEKFVDAWIKDVTDLGDTDDRVKLTFPEGL